MKKKVLFVIDSLETAGAEKSLVTLLSLLDYSKMEVDLLLFSHGNPLEELLPPEVNMLSPLNYSNFAKLSLQAAIIYSLKNKKINMLSSRLSYSLKIRKAKLSNPQKARLYWESISKVIPTNEKNYDIAISYAQGIPTFYVAEKIIATKKFAWVNASLRLKEEDKSFQKQYYDYFQTIVTVSETAKSIFLETFPDYHSKTKVIYDITDFNFIKDMAEVDVGYNDSFTGTRILTIGRIASQKGYDIALEACKILKEKGFHFKWYVLGKGPLEEKVKQYIAENALSNYFILLGTKTNPYPYIKQADIYVQTSRYEGYGLAIAEARMLNVPVVTTRFEAVYNQMVHEKNGLVVDMAGEAVAEGVVRLLNNPSLTQEIKAYLSKEKKGNREELDKFYELIG